MTVRIRASVEGHRKCHWSDVVSFFAIEDCESSSRNIEVHSDKNNNQDGFKNIAQNRLMKERMTVFDNIFNILHGTVYFYMILLGLTLYLFVLTLYFTLTLDVKNVSCGCLNAEIRTASSLPILIDFFDFLPKLCSLVRNIFVPTFRSISHGIETRYKVAKICLKLIKIKSTSRYRRII